MVKAPNFQPLNSYNSAAHCPISLKIGRWVRYGPEEVAHWLKSTYRKMQGSGLPPSFKSLHR